MIDNWLRGGAMAILLAAGSYLLRPAGSEALIDADLRFEECAAEVGLEHTHTMCRLSSRFENIMPWLRSVGAAVAARDVDGDGRIDLYLTRSGRGDSNRLLRNLGGGRFEEITGRSGTGVGNRIGASMDAVFGDIDNDGDADLYVVMWGEANRLFENLGDGRFRDIGRPAGVAFRGYGNGAVFLDYDRDGLLDLLVGNYFPDSLPDPDTGAQRRLDLWDPFTTRVMHESFTRARNGGRNVLYRNLGNNSFADVTERTGLDHTGWTLAVGSSDLDGDGWPDLYIANDFGPDEIYFNTGATEDPPHFRPFIGTEGHPAAGDDWWKGMNVDFGDVDGNGYPDIYVTNILAPRYKTDEGNMLWLNFADPEAPHGRRFVNVARRTATHDGGWGWGAKFADLNNDRRLDIFAVNGFATGDPDHTYWYALQEMVTQLKNATADAADWPEMGSRDLSGYEPNRLWLQIAADPPDGELRFAEIAAGAGIDDLYNGRGAAVLDADEDGDLDLYIANQGAPGSFYRNLLVDTGGPGHHFMRLRLVGDPEDRRTDGGRRLASTRDAVGARVRVAAGGVVQTREVDGGCGFAAQSEPTLHFGLGDTTAVESVTIRWPSGRQERLIGMRAAALVDRTTTLREADQAGGAR